MTDLAQVTNNLYDVALIWWLLYAPKAAYSPVSPSTNPLLNSGVSINTVIVVTAFATAYFIIGQTVGPALTPIGAWVFSMTSFHGRGFFPGLEGKHSLHDPLIMLAACEAVIGLFIEISFIATFTQRFFGR